MTTSTMDNNLIRLKAVGDIMLGDHPVCFGHGVRSTIEQKGFEFLLKHTCSELSDADILFGNLETVLAEEDEGTNIYDLEMKGKWEYGSHLSNAGFNVMSVANNHAMQHGLNSFTQTLSSLDNAGIHSIGIDESGQSNCYIFEKDEISLAFIAYSFRPEKYSSDNIPYANNNRELLLQQIARLSNMHAHVIVSIHWGEEYLHLPSVDQVLFAKEMVDAGARLILGHHPHVLQGIETYKNAIIVYSMGNFIFDHWQLETRETVIFDCYFGKNNIDRYEIIPVLINKQYQPVPLTGIQAVELLNKIRHYSSEIESLNSKSNSIEESNNYQAYAKKAYKKYRIQSYSYFLRNIYRYKISTIIDSLFRFVKRRIDPSHP